MEYKVGDRIKNIAKPHINMGKFGTVTDILSDGWVDVKYDDGRTRGTFEPEKYYGKVEDKSKFTVDPSLFYGQSVLDKLADQIMDNTLLNNYPIWGIKTNESLTQKVTKTMNSIVKKIKDLKLTESDRLLRKHGFEDENGNMTSEAMDLINEELQQERWDKRRLEIAADLKLVDQEPCK